MPKFGIFKLIVPKINHSPLQAFHIYFNLEQPSMNFYDLDIRKSSLNWRLNLTK
jgi:hypothetical protein